MAMMPSLRLRRAKALKDSRSAVIQVNGGFRVGRFSNIQSYDQQARGCSNGLGRLVGVAAGCDYFVARA
jgi:hypothetical protein